MSNRNLCDIADDIRANWPRVSPHAAPYLNAMRHLTSVKSNYGYDSGDSIVRYFLANANTWRGDEARRIKTELRSLLK